MDVRAQTSMVFHLDKCIGCHTCSVACKNIWTDRPGAEYMWWNNVETKPGTGFPSNWEDQVNFKGGWVRDAKGKLRLRGQSKAGTLLKLFYNPNQPGLDDYYEPWTYRYRDLFDAPEGDDQPTAVPVSLVTGKQMEVNAGPNWDDDLGGSPIYAENDPNLEGLTEEERKALFAVEGMAMMYLPRICNHCVNPACVASCPSGALYKRGEDGIVLVNQEQCRGWRSCVSACPYKKVYYNWKTGKSEKCILCFPRVETGLAPACFHSCVGRIRFTGVLLYDADRIEAAMSVDDDKLVDSQLSVILDPNDPEVQAAAITNGMPEEMIRAAQRSPVYSFVKEWGLALPLHPEFRTLPMLFYVPPLLPVLGRLNDGIYDHEPHDVFAAFDEARIPLDYLATLFAAKNREPVVAALKKLVAVRYHRRAETLGGLAADKIQAILDEAGLDRETADSIYRLSMISDPSERFVMPPSKREEFIEAEQDVADCKGSCGFGKNEAPRRGW
jgi:nitrate reductase beta subunit